MDYSVSRAVFLAVILVVLAPVAGRASEGGTSHYLPGTAATLIDLVPTQPGWVIEPMYLHYENDAKQSENIPVAGLNTAKLKMTLDAATLASFYTFEESLWGAYYSVGVALPYVWLDVSAEIETALGPSRVSTGTSGLGDATLLPVMLAWKNGPWQYSAAVSVYAPTGEYDEGKVANTGLNYWSFSPWGSVSYSNPETGFNAALYAGLMFNTENEGTDYDSGDSGHLEVSVQQMLPLGRGFATLGIEGFWLEQIEADSGQADFLGDFEGRTAGVGPVLGYLLPTRGANIVVELRWLAELESRNRLKGDYIWLKTVYQF